MPIDLKKMTRKELLQLQKDVEVALVDVEKKEREKALQAAQAAAGKFGFSLDELTSAGGASRKKRGKATPKYRNPENHEQTWSGLGRKPQWIHDSLAKGLDITELEI